MATEHDRRGRQRGKRWAKVPQSLPRDRRLSDAAYRVLTVLLSYRNQRTGIAFPSLATIARDTAKTKRTVQRLIADIESVQGSPKLLEVDRGGEHGRGDFSIYRFPFLEGCRQ